MIAWRLFVQLRILQQLEFIFEDYRVGVTILSVYRDPFW